MSKMGIFAGDGGDPRLSVDEGKGPNGIGSQAYTRPQLRKLHDPSVKFEEYQYYAQKTRLTEDDRAKMVDEMGASKGILQMIFPAMENKKAKQIATEDEKRGAEVAATVNTSDPLQRAQISDAEWINANRALRTASWGAIFYLVTTDILGPFGLPFAFATMGWGPGVALFTVFAGLAGYSGYLLWTCFMGLDSYEFPVKNFGDLGYRVYGSWARYLFNILQAIQLILNVGAILVSNGLALSQATKFKLCFAVCLVIWAVVGFAMGQVRTLQKFGWLANFAVFLNLIVIGITMGAAATTAPNYAATDLSAGSVILDGILVTPVNGVYPPVQTSGGLPDTSSFVGALNGAMSAVFSYGGSMIFPEFMSEMKRPRDFLKGMWFAQLFIYIVYMFYGLFMYGYQGQYTTNPTYLGVSQYNLQTAGNVFAMVSAIIAASLYGNIGVKVIYNNIFVEIFRAPPLTTMGGKIAWVVLIPIYWALGFVIGASIPDFIGLTSVVAAFCILHFTYTFPPLLAVGYMIQKNALLDGEGFDPTTGEIKRRDYGLKRYIRGFLADRWYMNAFNVLYFFGALALAGLGAYAAIENLIGAFMKPQFNSFTCQSPLG